MPGFRYVQVVSMSLLLASSGVVACAKRSNKSSLPQDDVVVAKVNGTTITRYDVDRIASHSLGKLAVAAGPESYPKLREAAVRSRAIALAAEAELNDLEKLALAKEAEAYREQVLVRRYLNKHAPPSAVSAEMVRRYYQEHPEQFGARTERSYEVLGATRDLTPLERDKLLGALKGVEAETNWQALAEKLSRAGSPVSVTTTTSSDQALDQRLRDALQQLEAGKVSPVTLIQGRVYVARTKGEQKQPPRPFEEVSGEIERLLTPGQLSDAIEAVSKDVLAKATVELIDPKPTKAEAKP